MPNDKCRVCGARIIMQIFRGTGYCSTNCKLGRNAPRASEDIETMLASAEW